MAYIHLRDKSKPLPTLDECVKKFRKIRKKNNPISPKPIANMEVKYVEECKKTDGQKAG